MKEVAVNVLKVAANSDAQATAGAVANTFREEGVAELQAIGPKAVNQAVKSIAIARGYVAPSGIDLFFVPSFVEVEVNGEVRTGIRFTVRSRTPVLAQRPRARRGEKGSGKEEWKDI